MAAARASGPPARSRSSRLRPAVHARLRCSCGSLLGALAVSLGDIGGWLRGVVVDWLPFFLVLTAYDLARGGADGWLAPTHFLPQADVDAWLFGGTVPTRAGCRRTCHHAGQVRWFEVAAFLVYVSHFFVTPLLAAVLWVRDRWRFRRFAASLALLTLLGCITFVAFPAAPPWMASEHAADRADDAR